MRTVDESTFFAFMESLGDPILVAEPGEVNPVFISARLEAVLDALDRPRAEAALKKLLTAAGNEAEERPLKLPGWSGRARISRWKWRGRPMVTLTLKESRPAGDKRLLKNRAAWFPDITFRCRNNFPDYTMDYISDDCFELTGYTPEELIGNRGARFIDLVHPEDLPAYESAARRTLAKGLPMDATFRLVRKNGEIRWVWERSRVTAASEDLQGIGEVEGYLSDITEKRRGEEAEEDCRIKNDFLSNISHELRTPLNGILGLTTLLMESELAPHQGQYARSIHQSAETLLGVIDDILDFSNFESGRFELEKKEFSLTELLAGLKEMFAPAIERKKLKFSFTTAPGLPERVKGDAKRLRQILANLLSNAVKFTASGTISLECSHKSFLDEGRFTKVLYFTIRDTGIGIKPELARVIFSPFTQADASSTRRFDGCGLGLSVCAQLIKMMNGGIHLESAPGRGSAFSFHIRLEPADGGPARRRKPLRILLAEGAPVNQLAARDIIERLGHRVDVVNSGPAALAALKDTKYDVAILALDLPEMDGLQTASALRGFRGDARCREVPIIAAGESVDAPSAREQCLRAGMDDCITRPFTLRELQEVTERWRRIL